MYQATPVAQQFGAQSYIVAIVSSLSFAMQPRGKFVQNLLWQIMFSGLAFGITTLGLWCARQAKQHTQGDSTDLYNSSAAAVAAIFLFCNVFAISSFRVVHRTPVGVADRSDAQI